jgi:hypothetical protein
MPLTPEALAADVRRSQEDLPQVALVARPGAGSFRVRCCVAETGASASLAERADGADYSDAPEATVVLADCAFAPRRGDRVTIAGRRFRVAAARVTPGDGAATLQLEAAP